MSTAALRAELGQARRQHRWRQRRLDIAHQRNDAKRIKHWHALLVQAGRDIRELEHELAKRVDPHDRIVAVARQAAANYRHNPRAYHYLAGGFPNTVILRPTPLTWRSDCSQFAVNVYRLAGLPCPGSGTFLYSNTVSIAAGGRLTQRPELGDLGLYGSRWRPHHVEVYDGGGDHIGHGSAPIDDVEPGRPSFYLSFIK